MVVRPFIGIESKSKYEELNELYNLITEEESPNGETISGYFQERGIMVSSLITRTDYDLAILMQTLRSISTQYSPTGNHDDHFIQEPSAIELYEDNWASIGEDLTQTILRIENLALESRAEEVEDITNSIEDDLDAKTKKLGPLLEKLFLAGEDKVRTIFPALGQQLLHEGEELSALLSQKWQDMEPHAKKIIIGGTAALVLSMSANDEVKNHTISSIGTANTISMSGDTTLRDIDPIIPIPTIDVGDLSISPHGMTAPNTEPNGNNARIMPATNGDNHQDPSPQIIVEEPTDTTTLPLVKKPSIVTHPTATTPIQSIPTITNSELVSGQRLTTTAHVQTFTLEDGSLLQFDHGAWFYTAQQGESLWTIWSKLKKYNNFSYLNQPRYTPSQKTVNGKTQAREKTFAWNVPDVFREGLSIPIPLNIAERKLDDLALIKSIQESLDLIKEHAIYGSFVNEIESSLMRNHLVKVMISFAQKESHAGSNSLSRYEPAYDAYSFSLYHILTEKARDGSNGPGLRALNKLGFSQGEVMSDPIKAGQRFWGYWAEKCTELSRSKNKSRKKFGKQPSILFAEKNLSTLGTIYNGSPVYGKALAEIYDNISSTTHYGD